MGDKQDDYEKLFLVEVLVDSLFISNSSLNLGKDLVSNLTDTCILFQFLHYPPMVVCESDFSGSLQDNHDNSHITFKSGKSCFFSLRSPRGPILPVRFDVKVNVVRRFKEGVLPDKIDIGTTAIDMTDDFTTLLKENTDENCEALPLSRNKKGTFAILDNFGRNVGNLTAFIRLSCFGKLIITQFSLNKDEEKSYLFKGTDVNRLCETLDSKSYPCNENVIVRKTSFGSPGDQTSPIVRQDPPCYGKNALSENDYRKNGSYPHRSTFQDNSHKEIRGFPEACQCPVCGCPIDYSFISPLPSQKTRTVRSGKNNLCSCPYPIAPSVMSKYAKRTEKSLGLSPGEVGMQDDQVIFQLPLKKPGEPVGNQDNSSVYYKLTSAEETKDGQQKNVVHIKPEDLPGMAAKDTVGPVSGLPLDDRHDVFLLKIGKKCEGDKKRNLELELRTPKMKEPKPPMTDQNTQYLESDIPQPLGKTSKDKGTKKGKNKKENGKAKKKGKK